MTNQLISRAKAAEEFEAAIAWAGEITDAAKASKAVDHALTRWQQTDPSTAPQTSD